MLGLVVVTGGVVGLAGLAFNAVPDGGAGGHLLVAAFSLAVLVGAADAVRLLRRT
ncbi:hypothetical protein [Nocardioides montaniterrae]